MEKVHAAVARSTFGSKFTKHVGLTTCGSRDVEKVPLWREAHLEEKMYRTGRSRTTCGNQDQVGFLKKYKMRKNEIK